MTRREIAEVACRILALAMFGYGWVAICGSLVHWFWFGRLHDFDLIEYTPTSIGVAWISVSAVIWFRAPTYASRMADDDSEPVVTTGLAARDVLSLACCVVGLWIAAPAFIALMNWALEFALSAYGSDGLTTAIRESLGRLATEGVKLVSGLLLIFGRHGLAEAVSRLRNAGVDRNSATSDEEKLPVGETSELPELLPADEEKSK